MPVPKKFQIAKRKAEREEKKAKLAEEKAAREAAEAAGIKLPKKPRVNKFAYPTPEALPQPKPITVAEAMKGAKSWQTARDIANKYSVGTLTTAQYKERVDVFTKNNTMCEGRSSLFPQSAYFGRDPKEKADVFCDREVKNLNDISFEEDSDWEEVKNLKRMPKTILNEENLREYLDENALRLNLENHYWIKNNMIQHIGRMAPNLMVLSFRRMKFISNPIFAEVFKQLKNLRRVDLSDCLGLLDTACCLMVEKNPQLSYLQLSGCTEGVNDEVLDMIANRLTTTLNFLDISYCKRVTDEGLAHFNNKEIPLESLFINGVNGISGSAVKQMLHSVKDNLLDFEAALNDQEIFDSSFFEVLGQCWNL